MMAPTGTMPTMKLLVDTKSQRMLYAEAGEDAVDFLFSLLSTPAVGDGGRAGGSILNLDIGAAAKKLAGVASSGGHGGGGHEAVAAAAPPPAPAAAMFTVMDDLKIAPMSTVSAIARLSTLGVKDIGALQEKIVQLGYAEVSSI